MDGRIEIAGTISGELSAEETLSGTLSNAADPLSGELTVPDSGGGMRLYPATRDTLGGIIVGDDLSITPEGRLSVDKATAVEHDNTRPITSAAVYVTVGNINALLGTI